MPYLFVYRCVDQVHEFDQPRKVPHRSDPTGTSPRTKCPSGALSSFWGQNAGGLLKLHQKNQDFVNYRGQVGLEPFPYPVNKVKFRTNQLVFPVHLQLGGGRGPVLGVGGFGGLTLKHMHKIKYEYQGDELKDNLKKMYNVN